MKHMTIYPAVLFQSVDNHVFENFLSANYHSMNTIHLKNHRHNPLSLILLFQMRA